MMGVSATSLELVEALDELRAASETMGEPRLESRQVIEQYALHSPTWEMCNLWQELMVSSRTYQEHARIRQELRAIIQAAGHPFGIPESLKQSYARVKEFGADLNRDFW